MQKINHLWSLVIDNFNVIISTINSVTTFLASVVAIVTLTIWRKQQLYNPKFTILMDLEDSYEILITEYGNMFNWFFQRQKLASSAPEKYKKTVNDKITEDYKKLLLENKLSEYSYNYQLAYTRVRRIIPEIENTQELQFKQLEKCHESCMNMIKKERFSNDADIEKVLSEFANKYIKFGNDGRGKFQLLRKSI